MGKRIQISIPTPCHEDWQQMIPVEKGRFCATCQKKVFDFTNSSDREITAAFKQNKQLCGRFLNTQLNRDLVEPKAKNSLWIAASAGILSLISVNEGTAQTPMSTEQHQAQVNTSVTNTKFPEPKTISGTVSDETGPLSGALVLIKGTETVVQTDIDGKFSISANKGDILEISYVGFGTQQITVTNSKDYHVVLMESGILGMVEFICYKKRTFFGRIFHGIGNWFR